MAASTALVLSTGCVSATVIRSEPSGATVYIDGSKVGRTPYTYADTKTVSSITRVRLRKEGYEDFETLLVRNEEFQAGPCVGGVFLLVPLLWVMGYHPEHNYELTPLAGNAPLQQPMYPEQPLYPEQPGEPMPPPPPPSSM
ncbi:MAG TPA: PEGA domain-containing protein [Hyalangium sp.]|nr:PEGA domain-containing protein [Hyalangium sp.]